MLGVNRLRSGMLRKRAPLKHCLLDRQDTVLVKIEIPADFAQCDLITMGKLDPTAVPEYCERRQLFLFSITVHQTARQGESDPRGRRSGRHREWSEKHKASLKH